MRFYAKTESCECVIRKHCLYLDSSEEPRISTVVEYQCIDAFDENEPLGCKIRVSGLIWLSFIPSGYDHAIESHVVQDTNVNKR